MNITDNTKLVRFLDSNGAEKSIDLERNGNLEFTFRHGLLHDYRTLETNAGDEKEGITSLSLPNNIIGKSTVTNKILVSCWSIWDETNDPWHSFKSSSFAKESKYICAIVSTVGKVREINQLIFNSDHPNIFFYPIDRPVAYYSASEGVNLDDWKEKTNTQKHGLGAQIIQTIFHKRDSHPNGQRYDAECEYRFAIICNSNRKADEKFDKKTSLEEKLIQNIHYIEKVYLRNPPNVEPTCIYGNIELIKHS
ncbi:MAG: hypothetical protein KBD83_07125 [Gammaproteobacteria bacterium]|nr:hypothetical protein [Gammaproteobacteria bacterium]